MQVYSPAEAAGFLRAFEEIYASMGAREWYGDHICMAAHPSTVHGSPDDIVEAGVPVVADVADDWVARLVASVEGQETEHGIRAALQAAAENIDVEEFAELLWERMMAGLELGGLDSQWEREQDKEIAPTRFKDEVPFVKLPRQSAIDLWHKRQVLPPEQYAALSAEMKAKAFSFAGAAKEEMLNVAHAELGRGIREGATDLRGFKRQLGERLETAGWTAKSPTHLETIVRTNVSSAMAVGRKSDQTQPDVLKALPFWEMRGVGDARQRPTHAAATRPPGQNHGIILPATHPFWMRAYPPWGYNCFLPGTEVRGNFETAVRSAFSGLCVELVTESGRRLKVTARHPILTNQGFLPSRELRLGSEILVFPDGDGVTAEKVFALAGPAAQLWSAPNEAFHGEARDMVGSELRTPAATIRAISTFASSLKTADAGGSSDVQLFLGLAGAGLRPERIVRADMFTYEGYVYDFQTESGWLGAGGIVASNCRCSVLARTRSWMNRMKATIGPVPRGLPDPGFASSGRSSTVTVPSNYESKKPAPPTQKEQPQAPRAEDHRPSQESLQRAPALPPSSKARRDARTVRLPRLLPSKKGGLPTLKRPPPKPAPQPGGSPRWVPSEDGSGFRGVDFLIRDVVLRKAGGRKWELVLDGKAYLLPNKPTFDHAEALIRDAAIKAHPENLAKARAAQERKAQQAALREAKKRQP